MASPFVSRIVRPTLGCTLALGTLALLFDLISWQEQSEELQKADSLGKLKKWLNESIRSSAQTSDASLQEATAFRSPSHTLKETRQDTSRFGDLLGDGATRESSIGDQTIHGKWAASSWAATRDWATTPLTRENACKQLDAVHAQTWSEQASSSKDIAKQLLQTLGLKQHPLLDMDLFQELRLSGQDCRLLRWLRGLLEGREVSKVVVLGNSVTEGAELGMDPKGSNGEGCKCSRSGDCEPRLRQPPFQNPFRCNTAKERQKVRFYCCSWLLQFVTWLHRVFPNAKVEHVLVSEAGIGSPKFGGTLERRLAAAKVNLEPNDLVIVNLGIADTQLADAGINLTSERLFGKLAESLSFPLLLLDVDGERYMKYYQQFSTTFSVPLFNFTDVLASARERGKFRANNIGKIIQRRPHPPWPWHQLLADALALALVAHARKLACSAAAWDSAIASQCLSPAWNETAGTCAQEDRMVTQQFVAAEEMGKLAESTSGLVAERKWDITDKSLWQFFEDRAGKPGWIASIADSNRGSDKSFSPVLTFMFTNDLATKNKWFLHVDVTFMRTYEDAGWTDVRICGVLAGRLDALWSVKASMPEVASFRLGFTEAKKRCGLSYQCTESCGRARGGHRLNVTFKHISDFDHLGEVEKSSRLPGAKFKILSVDLCMKTK